MPVEKEIIRRLLLYLEEQIKLMRRRSLTQKELEENLDLRAAMERRLQVAIEVCIDISRHLIAGEGLGVVEHNKDTILKLGEKGIIPQGLASRVASATDMRNVLVHGYEKVRPEEVYRAITEDIGDLENFAQEIDLFISRK